MDFALPKDIQFAGIIFKPAGGDVTGAAPYIATLKGAHKAYIVCLITQGNAATTALTPLQASSVSGATKALTAVARIWSCLDYATTDALVARTAAVAYTLDAATKTKIVIFEIDPLINLDQANNYDCITLDTSGSNAANVVSASLWIVPRYNPPGSVIAN